MARRRHTIRTVLIVLALAANGAAIGVWVTRLPLVYGDWLGMGRRHDTPCQSFVHWLSGNRGPWTPAGLVRAFDPIDLAVGAALLFVMSVLIILLVMAWAGRSLPLLAKMQTRLTWPPSLGVGVRAAMMAIAVVALELGWEVNGWETWRLRSGYAKQLSLAAEREANFIRHTQRLRRQIEQLESSTWSGPDDARTKEAIEADRLWALDVSKRDLASAEAQAIYYAALVEKYTRAVDRARAPISPDPPVPARELSPREWTWLKEYGRALEALDAAIRRYPALWDAHRQRAWILATCPDPQIRDGEAAVRSATRACELTKWNRADVLLVLAAAYAEAGDFKSAIRWQKQAMERLGPHPPPRMNVKERLALYEAGQPYHE